LAKILVVDDTALMLRLLQRILQTAGYEVVCAVDGQEGLDKVVAEKPDYATRNTYFRRSTMGGTKVVVLAAGKGTRMKSELPKVLHTVDGKSMIQRAIDRVHELGIPSDDVIVVVGYEHEMVMERVGDAVHYVLQTEQLGTGHAVLMAREHLRDFDGKVVVLYGDMPLINPRSIQRLLDGCTGDVKGTLLTVVLDNPPDFGRIMRGPDGGVTRIIEVKDADLETLAIREVNVGMYCFDNLALQAALDSLSNDNAQGEYYLTDVIGLIDQIGGRVETVLAGSLEETLGVNDPTHLRFAESLKDIEYAESLYELIDATLAMQRGVNA